MCKSFEKMIFRIILPYKRLWHRQFHDYLNGDYLGSHPIHRDNTLSILLSGVNFGTVRATLTKELFAKGIKHTVVIPNIKKPADVIEICDNGEKSSTSFSFVRGWDIAIHKCTL